MKKVWASALCAVLLVGCSSSQLAGCATVPDKPTAVNLQTADDKAMLAAEATFQALLIATNAAVESGQLRGENAAKVGVALTSAKSALDAARAAYAVGNAVQASLRLADFASAVASARVVLGK